MAAYMVLAVRLFYCWEVDVRGAALPHRSVAVVQNILHPFIQNSPAFQPQMDDKGCAISQSQRNHVV